MSLGIENDPKQEAKHRIDSAAESHVLEDIDLSLTYPVSVISRGSTYQSRQVFPSIRLAVATHFKFILSVASRLITK